jgi:membrane protease YdiL (CAAX protease family)
MSKSSKNKLITFFAFLLALSSIFYSLIISNGSIYANGGIYTLGLMWSPGLAAMLTQLIFHKTLRGLGWKPGKFKYLAIAYILPVLYCLIVYGFTWSSQLGNVPNPEFFQALQTNYGISFEQEGIALLIFIMIMATFGVFSGLISGAGEEIGWRGFLVPELCKSMSFTKAMLLSGAIWAAWHMPLLLFADYNMPGVPKLYALIMFVIMVMGISFAFGWLRLKSGSLWPAALLHASHNLFVQNVFTPLTEQKPITPFIIDEFGVGLAIMGILVAIYFWRKRNELTIQP